MNYEKEVEVLKENEANNGDWYKPKTGKHTIEILEEPEEMEKTFEGDSKATQQIRLKLLEDGKKFTWDIGKGLTLSSVYGQFMALGKAKGKLAGEKVTLLVKNDGKRNSYTIMEALDIVNAEQAIAEEETVKG